MSAPRISSEDLQKILSKKGVFGKHGDLSGRKFGKWTVESVIDKVNGEHRWDCVCECGTRAIQYSSHIIYGKTKMCTRCRGKTFVTHGFSGTPTYFSWRGIIARCKNEKNPKYPSYGGRGIKVCDRWLSFENFLSDMGQKPTGTSIERIDNNGNYCPENCKWATPKEQALNRRSNVKANINGEIKSLSEIADEIGVNRDSLYSRVSLYGWTPEDAATIPIMSKGQKRKQ